MQPELAVVLIVVLGILSFAGLIRGIRRTQGLLVATSLFLLFVAAGGLGAFIGLQRLDSYMAGLKADIQLQTGGTQVGVTSSDSIVWDVDVDGKSMFLICKKATKAGEDPCVLATVLTQK